jgi:hypothetical protein
MAAGVALGLCVLMSGRFGSAHGRAQELPLPDRDSFIADVRKHLKSDERLQSQYTFTERERRTDFDGGGRPQKRSSKTYEVYPSSEKSPSYRRLIAVDGVQVPPRKLEEADRKHREEVLAWVKARTAETESERARRLAKEREDDAHESRVIDDIQRVYDLELAGREMIHNRPAIVVTLTPRPGARPLERESMPMTKLRGRAWIDEHDREVVRVEVESTDTLTFGWGILARVQKGTTLAFERVKVNDEVWLPARTSAHPKARIALLKKFDAEIVSEFSDYRKFTVDTSVTFGRPKHP